MGVKSERTTRSIIKHAMRKLFLQSRERNAAVKACGNTCSCCGKKNSRAKGKEVYCEVHHTEGILNWAEIYEAIYKNLLCEPGKLKVLCKECHQKEHDNE